VLLHVNLALQTLITVAKEETQHVLNVQWVRRRWQVVQNVKRVVPERMVLGVKIVVRVNTVRMQWPHLFVNNAPLVLVKVVKVKRLVCPAFRENFKILQVNPRAKHALKIRKVKKQIRLNVIPAMMVKSLKKAVLNVLNAKRVKPALV